MYHVSLTESQIELVAEACGIAADEHARFLDHDVRRALADALRAMGKMSEAESIEP